MQSTDATALTPTHRCSIEKKIWNNIEVEITIDRPGLLLGPIFVVFVNKAAVQLDLSGNVFKKQLCLSFHRIRTKSMNIIDFTHHTM